MGKVFAPEVRERFLALVASGGSLAAAAGAVGVSRSTASQWWRDCGGMPVQVGRIGGIAGRAQGAGEASGAVAVRGRYLSSEERAVIAAGLGRGCSYADIGSQIGRDKSVVCREVRRNRGPDGVYRAPVAQARAAQRRRRPKPFKLVEDRGLCGRIESWMDDGWSPGLIAGVLAREHGDDHTGRVSHETIYQALYVQTRGRLRADLYRQLSLGRASRKPRTATTRKARYSPYAEAFTIAQRPAEVADRAVAGHWEGDLILGTGCRSAIGTLVERQTRFTILLHLPGRHDADEVAKAMIAQMSQLPEHLRRTITWDRGVELAAYQRIQMAVGSTLYVCDPYSP
ncbi:MAG: IS30 family transposase, partial [Actinomycetes bacterium]